MTARELFTVLLCLMLGACAFRLPEAGDKKTSLIIIGFGIVKIENPIENGNGAAISAQSIGFTVTPEPQRKLILGAQSSSQIVIPPEFVIRPTRAISSSDGSEDEKSD